MKTATASVVLSATPSAFWEAYLDPEYCRVVYLGELGYKALEVLEATSTSRKLRVTPKLNVPGPIAKLIGDAFTYEDHGTLDREKNVWTWRMMPPSNGPERKNIVTTSGRIRIEAVGDAQCRRTDELTIEAHVFGLGGLIESSAEKEARTAWDKEFAYLQRRFATK